MGKRAFEGGDGGVCVDEVRRAVKRLCTLEGSDEEVRHTAVCARPLSPAPHRPSRQARAGIAPSVPVVEAGRASPALEAPPCPPLGGELPPHGAAHAENWAMRRPRAATEGSQESPRWRGCVLLHARLHSPAVPRLVRPD